jgi:hypothetical protein
MADTPFSNLSIGLKYFNHLQVTRWVLIREGAIVHSRAKLSPVSSALLRSQNRFCQFLSFISLSLFAELTPRFSSTTQDHDEDFSQRQFVLISAGSQLCGPSLQPTIRRLKMCRLTSIWADARYSSRDLALSGVNFYQRH